MPDHRELLDERESLRRPFVQSLALHGSVVALALGLGMANFAKREQFGDPNAMGGGALDVTTVKTLPFLQHNGPKNKVANDTPSQVPEPITKPEPKTKAKTVEKEPADAIPMKDRNARRPVRETYRNPRTTPEPQTSNQLTSTTGQTASSPLYAPAAGSGMLGVGNGAPFGTRFGAYAALVRDRVSPHWRTEQIDQRLRTLPPAVVTFEIQRDGQVRNIRIEQSSGNGLLDNSAQRAIAEAAPFPPLPAQYSGSSATVEFWFKFQR
jgi:protein TonB